MEYEVVEMVVGEVWVVGIWKWGVMLELEVRGILVRQNGGYWGYWGIFGRKL